MTYDPMPFIDINPAVPAPGSVPGAGWSGGLAVRVGFTMRARHSSTARWLRGWWRWDSGSTGGARRLAWS